MSLLKPALVQYPKAEVCFDRHWKQEDSAIRGIERSNRCAERGIRIMEELFPKCKTPAKFNARYLLTNDKLH
jgi:hypothetical protein